MDWMEYVLYGIFGVIGLICAVALFFLLRWIYIMIFFTFSFGPVKHSTGKVIDMEYTPSRSEYNAATKTTSYTSEKNEVMFETPQGKTTVDSDHLYQRVRVGEAIKVAYQERHIKPRYWAGDWKDDGLRLISVTSALNQTVNFNDEKPNTYGH